MNNTKMQQIPLPIWLRSLRYYCSNSPINRGKSRLVKLAYDRLPVPNTSVSALLDNQFEVELKLKSWPDYNAYIFGLYEHYYSNYFRRQLEPNWTFFDIGAYIGQYSLVASSILKQGNAYAFEPNPASIKRIRSALEINNIGNVSIIEKGVSATESQAQFHVGVQPSQSSLLEEHAPSSPASLTISTTSIDAFCEQEGIEKVNIMKIDVEEAEDNVIRGAVSTIEQHKPLIMIEIGEKSLQGDNGSYSLEFLRQQKYQLHVLERSELLPLTDKLLRPGLNVIALPNGYKSR